MRRLRLTSDIVDKTPPPPHGEIRISDKDCRGLGLRVWAGPNGGGRAFDLRAKNEQGNWTRRTFQPWSDARPVLPSNEDPLPWFTSLGIWLDLAREWAEEERYRLSGRPTPREASWAAYQEIRRAAEERSLVDHINLVLEEGKISGWSTSYIDAIEDIFHKLPENLLRTPLGEVDPEAFYQALVTLPVPYHRIDKLRSFMSKVPRSEVSAHAGYQLSARHTTNIYHQLLEDEWHPSRQKQLSEYKNFVPKVMEVLRDDIDHWVPAMALSMYLRTGAKQAPLLKARWSSILDQHWYPYPPDSRSSWFWARELLDDDLYNDIQKHHERVIDHFGNTDLLFPSSQNSGKFSPITSLQRVFRRALRTVNIPNSEYILLRDFALVAKSRTTPALFMNPNLLIHRIIERFEADEKAAARVHLSKSAPSLTKNR